jgi:hypothetical protein
LFDADDRYDELRDDCVDWEPPTEYEFEDGSPAPDPDEVPGYVVVAEREEADSCDDDGFVDGIVRFVTVRKLPRPVAVVVPGRVRIRRHALPGRRRTRARRSPSACRANARGSPERPRSRSDEDDDPADLTAAGRGDVGVRRPVESTTFQVMDRAFLADLESARRDLGLEERRVLWAILAVRVARETARDADWDGREGSA